MDIDRLTLLAGKKIPCPLFRTNITQPKLDEIAIIGEKSFYEYLSIFKITKDDVLNNIDSAFTSRERAEAVKTQLSFYTDFQIVLEMQREDQKLEIGLTTLLMMLFPQYNNIKCEDRFILMSTSKLNSKGLPICQPLLLDDNKWSTLCNIASVIFCLDENANSEDDFNPASEQARLIAEKLKKRHALLNQNQQTDTSGDVISCLVSSLAIGADLSLNEVFDYTLYQFFNQLKRYNLHQEYLNGVSSILAGAKKEEVELVDWMKRL